MKRGNKYRICSAAVLATIFAVSLLAKPVHILFPDEHHAACHSEAGHDDCAICQFTLSNFTTQSVFTVEKPVVFLVEIATERGIFDIPQKQFSFVSLRAPPAR
ncbi:MAG: hypothetical protein LBT61_02295 [Prevotellaceae bacterium]|jgi:hypothetical protein|nr:hypothetical protein [Prevotellaceae bacterium]